MRTRKEGVSMKFGFNNSMFEYMVSMNKSGTHRVGVNNPNKFGVNNSMFEHNSIQ